jgi:hypothetical protein
LSQKILLKAKSSFNVLFAKIRSQKKSKSKK